MKSILKLLLCTTVPQSFWGAVIGAVASFAGQQKSASDSIGHSKYQMDYQRDLANTAHVRQVADLRAAGLNPILSAKLGGAGNVSAPGAQIPDYGQSISRGVQAYSARNLGKLQQSQSAQASSSAKLLSEQQNTEQVRQNQLAQQAAKDHALASEHHQKYLTERSKTEAERLRLAERRAEHAWWSAVSGAGKGAGAFKTLSDIGKNLKKPKIFKKGYRR